MLLAGCAANNESPTPTATHTEYTKATAVKLGISFSFEYPASYITLTPDAFEDTGDDPAVSLFYLLPGRTSGNADMQIYIRPCDPLPSRPDAATWTEEHIKLLEENDSAYELIERSTIQVAGIDGQMAAYHSSILGKYLNSTYLICWDAYIDYQGYIWKISVVAIEELADQAQSDFDHLIETFEFLD